MNSNHMDSDQKVCSEQGLATNSETDCPPYDTIDAPLSSDTSQQRQQPLSQQQQPPPYWLVSGQRWNHEPQYTAAQFALPAVHSPTVVTTPQFSSTGREVEIISGGNQTAVQCHQVESFFGPTCLSCFVFWFVNPIFGIIAFTLVGKLWSGRPRWRPTVCWFNECSKEIVIDTNENDLKMTSVGCNWACHTIARTQHKFYQVQLPIRSQQWGRGYANTNAYEFKIELLVSDFF